jgi:hypothetical protein
MGYGKKNHVKLDPLSYNIYIGGESKIGKTTTVMKICEKLAGEEGYLFAEVGQERGADAIEGINHVNCPCWDMPYDEDTNSLGFEDIVSDICDNKTTEYKNLRVFIIDTYDQLINIAEDKSIALYNRTGPEKKAATINAAWGGFGRGEKKAIELMLDAIARLREVGVSTIVIGHVKTKDVSDVVSGESYQILTSDQQQNYFNAIKKNMHIVAMACIDRQVVREKTGKKDFDGKEKTIGKITSEARVFKFRDDTYSIDAGGRFANIVSEVPLDADSFIEAVNNAILAEQSKSGKTLAQTQKEEAAQVKKQEEKIKAAEDAKRAEKEFKDTMGVIVNACKTNPAIAGKVVAECQKLGCENPSMIKDIETAKKLAEFVGTLG